jgi:uncharacterized glyoxalase superfamily protein PhnB
MQVQTYLSFNGQCKEAFAFYARCFGGQVDTSSGTAGPPWRIAFGLTGRTR